MNGQHEMRPLPGAQDFRRPRRGTTGRQQGLANPGRCSRAQQRADVAGILHAIEQDGIGRQVGGTIGRRNGRQRQQAARRIDQAEFAHQRISQHDHLAAGQVVGYFTTGEGRFGNDQGVERGNDFFVGLDQVHTIEQRLPGLAALAPRLGQFPELLEKGVVA